MATADETKPNQTPVETAANVVVDDGAQLGVRRYFTIPGRDPFDEVEWELREAFIPGKDKPVFEQKDVEFPKFWSQTATNIVAQKYFRGRMGSPDRETSVKQIVGRVVSTIGQWGRDGGYFASDEEADNFEAELQAILVNQYAAFNSPVWFNGGFEAAGYDMSLDSADWASIQYQNANNSVRVTDAFMEAAETGADWNLTARTDGAVVETVPARKLLQDMAEAAWRCADPGVQYDTTINQWHTLPNTDRINASNPCSEYMSIDDSACNLSSINLLKFRREDGELDVEAFEHAVDVMFLAQEIAVGYSSYPTHEIERNAIAYRELGLGYANLGALLMSRGLPYDSDEGRAYAAAITALMTGRAYRKSAEIAARMGPFAGYQKNAAAMLGVMAKHRAAVGNIQHTESVPDDLLGAARRAWDEALDLGEVHGYRNSQATVLAPTGTISFMMDCDTTGVEPDFSLVKSKKLVGGGEITIVNKTVPMALERMGYAPREIEEIVAWGDERNGVVGAPYVKTEHYPVFDCAVGERAIHYLGHVKMMGAVQPFISGAISKTVNLPEEATVEDVAQLFGDAWRLGVKAIAIYRDNCKVAQPLSSSGKDGQTAVATPPIPVHERKRLPLDRTEVGRKFQEIGRAHV